LLKEEGIYENAKTATTKRAAGKRTLEIYKTPGFWLDSESFAADYPRILGSTGWKPMNDAESFFHTQWAGRHARVISMQQRRDAVWQMSTSKRNSQYRICESLHTYARYRIISP
jgi:hypothetical protein